MTAQQARQGRFAARWHDRRANRGARRAARLAARIAWRRGFYAGYVPWYGAVYWPYAYNDLFFYTFWPYAYEDGFWAYAYDDFFDGIFFPYGSPYSSYTYVGPYDGVTTGRRTSRTSARASVPGQVSQKMQQLCSQAGSGVTAWPFDRIEKSVDPTSEQRELLEDLRRAAAEAADRFKAACPEHIPLTPTGRLQAMTERLQATLDAVKLVRPPLEKFYQTLSDEQQARFNAIGPTIGKNRRQAAQDDAKADCGGDKTGLTAVPIERIEDAINPTGEQTARLEKLSAAIETSVLILEKACPDYVPQTPVGRLEAMQQRLEGMIEAANTLRPPLKDFYASLNSEQKARFNQLGRETARSGD